jgi:class 3 adenylate cyclase
LATQRIEQRLAAILAAEIAGYSRHMEAAEEGTLARLKAHRRELIDAKISELGWRIVKTTGDGTLIEFPSVVEAVSCALAVQQGMAEPNVGTPRGEAIAFRIGVKLGAVETYTATASILRRGWRGSPSPAASAFRKTVSRRP